MDDDIDYSGKMAAGPSHPDPEPEPPHQQQQGSSSSTHPSNTATTRRSSRLFSALMRHLSRRRATSMPHLHSDYSVPRDREPRLLLQWTPRDGTLYVDDGGISWDDVYGGGFGDGAVGIEGEECAVCLEGYAAGDAIRTMPCSHGFHERCIFGWLRVSRLCPQCRFALPAETEAEYCDDDVEEEDDEGE